MALIASLSSVKVSNRYDKGCCSVANFEKKTTSVTNLFQWQWKYRYIRVNSIFRGKKLNFSFLGKKRLAENMKYESYLLLFWEFTFTKWFVDSSKYACKRPSQSHFSANHFSVKKQGFNFFSLQNRTHSHVTVLSFH